MHTHITIPSYTFHEPMQSDLTLISSRPIWIRRRKTYKSAERDVAAEEKAKTAHVEVKQVGHVSEDRSTDDDVAMHEQQSETKKHAYFYDSGQEGRSHYWYVSR
eukprot:1391016-Amorphochlora_amoeboformis.AAC.1